ncbi:MAG: DUF333 domain-containing protein [Caldilinea sp. CFX5]|nr:DUF333 domain-containing protein [Caldilinea sp. CFX5]
MLRQGLLTIFLLGALLFSAACLRAPTSEPPAATMPNPASVYCEQHGGKLVFRQDAAGGVAGVCVFADGSECDEWAYYRGECKPGASAGSAATPGALPTPLPIVPADDQGWWSYTNNTYGFSLRLPPDWVVDESTTGDSLLNGHLLNLHPQDVAATLNIRMTYRRAGEEVLLWLTGVGEGEFRAQGTLMIAGQPAQRLLFVCPGGQVDAIWYHEREGVVNLQRGDLEFGFIFGHTGAHCQAGVSLDGKEQRVGEMIIASLTVP